MIRKRSEHGLGHLLNPLDPESDDRDWITTALHLIITRPELIHSDGGPEWFDLPALTKIALTTGEVAKAFDKYNDGKPAVERVRPFNFLLHAHHSFASQPAGTDMQRFRLIAPYESDPALWLDLPWVDLNTGQRHPVTTTGIPSPDTVLLKTYREVLATYAIHPEPKSLDPDGNPCTRRSPPGLLSRRPIEMLTISLIGKESNRLDESTAGLIGTLDDTLATYTDPGRDAWNTLIIPALNDFPSAEIARRAGLNTRTIQRIKKQAITKSHDRNRAVLTLITAQLASQHIERWGVVVPAMPLERIAVYIDERGVRSAVSRCVGCGAPLTNSRRRYCGDRCKKRAQRSRQRSRTTVVLPELLDERTAADPRSLER